MKIIISAVAIVLLFCQISCDEKKIDKIAIVTPIINAIKTIKIDSIKTSIHSVTLPKKDVSRYNIIGEIVCFDDLDAPRFKGGDKAFLQFLAKNFKYPETAENCTSTIYVRLIIDIDGSVMKDCVKVTKSICPDLDAEAIRVVQLSPNWLPAMQNKKPIRHRLRVPIKVCKRNK